LDLLNLVPEDFLDEFAEAVEGGFLFFEGFLFFLVLV